MADFDFSYIEQAIIEAGNFALQYHGNVEGEEKEVKSNTDVDTAFFKDTKSCFSFVDTGSQKIIMKHMIEKYSDLGIIGEESDDEINDLLKSFSHINGFKKGKYTLIIDPIDGTRNYLSATPTDKNHQRLKDKRGFWGVSLAITYGTTPVMGMIYYPALEDGIILKVEKGNGVYIGDERFKFRHITFNSEKDYMRVSSLLTTEGRSIRDIILDDKEINVGCFVTMLLAIVEECSGSDLAPNTKLPPYKGYIGKGLDILDLGCGSLAIEEANGFVGDFEGKKVNPLDHWRYDSVRKSVIVDSPFVMVPSRDYLCSLISYLQSKKIVFDKL